MASKGFMLYHDCRDIIDMLTLEEKGTMLGWLFDYSQEGKLPETKDRTLRVVFLELKRYIDINAEAYERKMSNLKQYQERKQEETRDSPNRTESDNNSPNRTESDNTAPNRCNNNNNNNNKNKNNNENNNKNKIRKSGFENIDNHEYTTEQLNKLYVDFNRS